MASKLCCTAEQESRPDSPELPNARLTNTTPAMVPLLPRQPSLPNSRFTSARSDELHELRQIFENAEDRASPTKGPRSRLSRSSMHSLHSLHKMKSMRSIIRRRFSKDLTKKGTGVDPRVTSQVADADAATVIKQPRDAASEQLKIVKAGLRKDLLSDKRPDEGGYDSDAEVLGDIAKNISKKSPSKRPSIHSIEWSSSMNSKATPASSKESHYSAELGHELQPYQILKPPAASLSSRFSHVLSTPNLRVPALNDQERSLRRSHSATSRALPAHSPLSPLRLPSLGTHDKDGVPWSEAMHKSLRLSQFPMPPRHVSPMPSNATLDKEQLLKRGANNNDGSVGAVSVHPHVTEPHTVASSTRAIEIRIQQATSIASPRPSTSVRGSLRENAPPAKVDTTAENQEDSEDNPRRSVHLYSMRISHHLRSGSLLSWDQLADTSEMPPTPRAFRERTVSDQSRFSHKQKSLARHERQTSSSGFASSKIPHKWGRVLPYDRDPRWDVASSIYSSRPQSPPGSFGGSMINLSRSNTGDTPIARKPRRSNSFPTDNEETPRAAQQYSMTNLKAAQCSSPKSSLLATPTPLARKNSVANTKKSKFREEFSPSPPRKRLTPSESIMKFLNPKRMSIRSNSEANLKFGHQDVAAFDGPFDTLDVPAEKERRQSRSLISLQAEQEELKKNNGANHVWDRALKAHQEEKASMFLPKNRELAVHASPFRERSGSTSIRRASIDEDLHPAAATLVVNKRYSAPTFDPKGPGTPGPEYPPALTSRRSATAGREDCSPGRAIANAFETQGDSTQVVGVWGKYPSHTRHDRNSSAGKVDLVDTRDFALEAAIRFASAPDHNVDDDLVDPTERLPSPPLLPGEKKRKKKLGSGRVAKSNSMTFGKTFLKNYSKIFKSQSTEFRRHGRGHRSSIASGGMLEYPELEVLPEVWRRGFSEEGSAGRSNVVGGHDGPSDDRVAGTVQAKGKLPADDSMATLRPRRNSSAPNLNQLSFLHDGADDRENVKDSARVWSVYYESCVPSFPRQSTDNDLEDFGPSRLSFDSKRTSMHSRTMPARLTKHSRHGSHLSRASVVSRGSARPSFLSMGEDDVGEDRSLVSVRRSTMDLIQQFKEQEATEHDKILALTGIGGRHEGEGLAAL
ncbi:hypothetical protein P153DRAFT_67951 [Dothidotthia symphoricarpi CBS 119687]|uniref:Uncharacterized protein n=1 Tax=Dothidotthia symphoricarpi CBS 119687 TaxID=1392245 RepID=A0A6A6A7A3_9PLEO|nr:uncharacterized protein P153DRAFT_67951 [Dothidotthia symphoricarpi CBS 119687]KAF2127456.1 hypothetical protein P153DRAFT_67951 [Dothidotthia symphoricarpi CBS 119687]